MANTDAPNGLKPVRHIAGGTIRPNEYKIPSGYNTAIFTGDAVKLLSSGYVAVAAAGNRLLGVFAGCSYPNSSGEQVFSRQWTASATTQGTADFTDIGNMADIVATAGSTSTGQSAMEVSGTTGTGTANLRILGLYNAPNNAYGTNGILEATIYEHELNQHVDADGTAGV